MSASEFDERCPGCFQQEAPSGGEACPTCDLVPEQSEEDRSPMLLPLGTDLRGRYRVGRVLGKPGGFGVTYLGFDRRLELGVAVKEYMPRDLAGRDTDGESVVLYSGDEEETFQYGLDRFLNEARMLAQFEHANIAQVRDFFEANGTAYLVMDYYEGKSLQAYLEELPGERMDPEIGTKVMLRVLDGLKEVHAEGYLHRDVKPDNIYLTQEGRPILIDFGAARLALGEQSRSLSVVMTEGYAPYEQYTRQGNQGPHTDVYGCGATLYRMLTGEQPPSAADRVVEDTLKPPRQVNPEVPAGLSEAVVEAMAMGDAERIQTAAALQERLWTGLGGEAGRADGLEDGWSSASDERSGEEASKKEEGSPQDKDQSAKEGSTSERKTRRRPSRRRRRRGRGWRTAALVAVLVVVSLGIGGAAVALSPGGQLLPEGYLLPFSDPVANHVEKARSRLDVGQLAKPVGKSALSAVKEALDRDPENKEARKLLDEITDRLVRKGDSLRQEGSLSAAASFYKRTLQIDERSKVQEKLNAVKGRIREQKTAEQLLGSVRSTLGQEAASPKALRTAAASVKEALQTGAQTEEAKQLRSQVASRLAQKGKALRTNGALEEAENLYERSLQLKEQPSVRDELVAVRSRISKLEKHERLIGKVESTLEEETVTAADLKAAITIAREAKKLRPGSGEAEKLLEQIAQRFASKGRESEESGNLETAVSRYKKSLALKENEEVHERLTSLQNKIQKQKKVNRLIGRARSVLEQSSPTTSELEEATETIREVQDLEPRNNRVETLLERVAKHYESEGDDSRARDDLERAADFYEKSLDINDSFAVEDKLGEVRNRIQEREEARRQLEEARSVLRQSSPSAYELRNAMEAVRQAGETVSLEDESHDLTLQIVSAWEGRGIRMARRKRHRPALECFNEAVSLIRSVEDYQINNEAVARLYYNRGLVLEKLRKASAAVDSYEKALAYNENYMQAQTARIRVIGGKLRETIEGTIDDFQD